MKFSIVPHDSRLNTFVKSMWFIEYHEAGDKSNFREYITFACAFPNIVFQLEGENFLQTSLRKPSVFIPRNHFTGLITTPIDIATRGSFKLFGVSFYPHVFKLLFNLNPGPTINGVFDVKSVVGNQSAAFNRLKLLGEDKMKFAKDVSDLLLDLIEQQEDVDPILDAGVSYIISTKGQSTIRELCGFLGYSKRHVERIFKRNVGISPKEYSSIVRFQNSINIKSLKEENNLTQLSTFYGYSDQSHFIREFKKFTSLTPKAYYFNNDNIGVGFVKYS